MKFWLPTINLLTLFMSVLQAQSFEYALTQPEYIGSEVNDIVTIDNHIYLAGGAGWCHEPAIWRFDTTGNLLDFKSLVVDREYSKISQIKVDTTNHTLVLLLKEKPRVDLGVAKIRILRIDDELNILEELSFDSVGDDLDPQSGILADSILLILSKNYIYIFDYDYNQTQQISLPVPISGEAIILLKNDQIFYYDAEKRDAIYKIDYQGNFLATAQTPVFTNLVIFKNNLFISYQNKVDEYNIDLLIKKDSHTFSSADSLELLVINGGFLQIISHRQNASSPIAYYDEDLRVVLDEKIELQYEKDFHGTIAGNLNLYQSSNYRKQWPLKYMEYPNTNFVPVLRKKRLIVPYEIDRPSLKIVDLELLNKLEPFTCDSSFAVEPYCVYATEKYLKYKMTVKNTGNKTVNNFAYYTNNVTNFLCYTSTGYHYIDQLNLAPGGQLVFEDSMQLHSVINYPNLEFYIVAPNHIISDIPTSSFSLLDATTPLQEENKSEHISLYPNPTLDKIQLDRSNFELSNMTYEIIDWSGKNILKNRLTDREIDISVLKSGTYFIRLQEGNKTYLARFIKTE